MGGAFLGSILGCFGLQVGGLGSKLEVLDAFLGSNLGLVGRQWGFGRPRGNRKGVWKGLGRPKGGWGPGNGSNMGAT